MTPSESVKKLNPDLFFKRSVSPEKYLQREAERMLEYMGYRRLTAQNVERSRSPKGFYGHWHRSKGNPLVLDLLILSPSGRYLMLELKTSDKWRPGQKKLIEMGYGTCCTYVGEVQEAVLDWEHATKKERDQKAPWG